MKGPCGVALFALLSGAAAVPTMNLHLMHDKVANGVQCLDGSPAGFYLYLTAEPAHKNDWVIFFQGGGWCYDEFDCLTRSKGDLGSSKSWQPTRNEGGILSMNCSVSPNFCNFNHLYLPYCDGNSFSGNRIDPLVVDGVPLYMRGRRILDAVLSEALGMGLAEAENVLLTGCSAGGLATFLHMDSVGKFLRLHAPNLKRYKAAPVSGFFLDHATVTGAQVYRPEMMYVFQMQNATHGVNDDCIASLPESEHWKCNFAPYTYNYLQTPVFLLNSALDSWQTGCIYTAMLPPGFPSQTGTENGICNVGSYEKCAENPAEKCSSDQIVKMNNYMSNFLTALTSSKTYSKNGNGAFVHSCHTHCEACNDKYFLTFAVGGVTLSEALGKWWASSVDTPAESNSYHPCFYHTGNVSNRNCNPTCAI